MLGIWSEAVLDENGGQLVPVSSKAGRAIQGIINRATAAEAKTWLPVYQERGVYNFYLKTKGGKRQVPANAAETIEKELNAAGSSDEVAINAPEARADPAEGAIEEVMEEVEESDFFLVGARCLSAGRDSRVDQQGFEPPPAVCQRWQDQRHTN